MPENIIKDCSYAKLMLYEIIKSIRIFFSKRQILSNNFKQISIKKIKEYFIFWLRYFYRKRTNMHLQSIKTPKVTCYNGENQMKSALFFFLLLYD